MASKITKGFIALSWVLYAAIVGIVVVLFMSIANGSIGYMPPVEQLENPIDKYASQVISADGKALGSYAHSKDNRIYVNYEDLSPDLVRALIATEDIRFAEHSGIDVQGLFRAVVKRGILMQKSGGGGSTITQQLAKQLFSPSADNVMERLFQKPIEWVIAVQLERYYTKEEIINGLTKGVEQGEIYPVYACSGTTLDGVDLLLDAIVFSAPSPAQAGAEKGENDSGDEVDVKCDPNGPLAAICFKTVADPFVGKMSYVKVISGKITADVPAFNARTGESERMGKLISVRGSKQEDISAITAGDIGVITKLSGLATGDTICSAKDIIKLPGVDFPAPSLSMAIVVKKKGEEDKVAAGLRRIMGEDPTVVFSNNEETREMILSGLGEQHLDIVLAKLKSKFGVEIDLKIPRVAYRETIRKSCQVQGRHKKQSGGSGQFGDVWIRFEPHDGDELIFETEVVGGSVPKNYFPAVEKGLQEAILKGPLAGYPMVGLKAVLYDGSYHPVDSNDMAFRTAAKIAYKNGMAQANPVILEPIGELKAYVPDANLGDIMGDITKRRGRVLGMGAADEPKMQELVAEVPMAEMGNFATTLRSVTAGRGHFSLTFARYEDAPGNVAQKVIEDAKAEADD